MTQANKISWYVNRIRCMSTREIVHRAVRGGYMRLQEHGLFNVKSIPRPDFSAPSNPWFEDIDGIDGGEYCRAADLILQGKVDILTFRDVELGKVPRWNKNVMTGEEAPLTFGKTLDYRDRRLVGDIKYIWVPNRHLQFVTLAQAYYLSGERKYLDGFSVQLNSWLRQTPYLLGPNWTSSLELAIRLINWSFAWHLIGGLECELFNEPEGKQLKGRWLESIYQQSHFIQDHFSRHSSANNHLLGEAAGLFVASVTWPYWGESKKWMHMAQDELTREMLLQNSGDGVNREQAIFYQQFVLDFILTALLVGKANGVEFSDHFWRRFESMLEFIASIMDVAGNVPMIGDADDGYVLKLSLEEDFCPYQSLLTTGAVLFSRPEFFRKVRNVDDKTRWLLGSHADNYFSSTPKERDELNLPVRRAFPDGGYYLMGENWETEKEIKLVMDAGPLGYLGIAAHGHADALALVLSVGGKEFLIDPGTYAYQSKRQWRDYFRGTAAHNTLRVDKQDQSVIGGNFMWLHKAGTTVEDWESNEQRDRLVASHNGYRRLRDPVLHRREVNFEKSKKRFRITDRIECKGTHYVERFWHFSENCKVKRDGKRIVAVNDGTEIQLMFEETDIDLRLCRGETNPPSGWVSRHFDVKVPTTTVIASSEAVGTTSLVSYIQVVC